MKYELTLSSRIELKLFQTDGKDNYYEIVGKDSPLSNREKAEIIVSLCKAQPRLMPRWHAQLKGGLGLGRNFIAVSEDE